MTRRYAVLDVFADRALAGNPLAVVLDAEGLDTERMQAIATEFNLAETVFALPAERTAHRARLRIFSPTRELPFAGHPTVGSAVLLVIEERGGAESQIDAVVVLEEEVGPVRCAVSLRQGNVGRAIFDAPRLAAPIPLELDAEGIATTLGLLPSEIGCENHLPSAYTAGLPYVFVPVRDADVLGRLRPDAARWTKTFPAEASLYVYTREPGPGGRHFRARMFWQGMGLVEDPATGSAAAAFAGVVADFDQLPAGTHRYEIAQGVEMGRPSRIQLEIDMAGGGLHQVRIGGDAIVVARGTIEV